MSNAPALLFAIACGAACGLFFFGGLWWTIQRGLRSAYAALWFLGSLLLRSGVVVMSFVWIGHRDWIQMLGALLGFIGMRCLVQHLIRAPRTRFVHALRETRP